MSLLDLTATELLAKLNAGEVTSVELTQTYLGQIERVDPKVKAFLSVRHELALQSAEEIDARRKAGKPVGRLAGLPVAVKDLLCTVGEATTAASRMLEHFKPPYDATVIAKLRAADAVILGKTNMDEFAMGGSTENSGFFPTCNPWDLQRTPGGSSGGAAACIAARMAPLSVGSDTGGSIRQPAALCGITGIKPTYGRVSRYGVVAFASSLDQIGPLAQTAEDTALLLEVIAGHDPLDSTSIDKAVPHYTQSIRQPLGNLRIGVVKEHFSEGLHVDVAAAVREAIAVYKSLGATIVDVELPHARYGVATYYVIAPCEASGNLARYDGVHYGHRTDEKKLVAELAAERADMERRHDEAGLAKLDNALVRMYRRSRAEGFGAEVKRRIMLGTYALSAGYYDAYYKKALKVRRLIRNDYDVAFKECDLILGPVTTDTAFKLGEKSADPLSLYLVDLYTVTANLAGISGIALPCGAAGDGLPIGFQLQGPLFAEESLLRTAHAFQQVTEWHKRKPSMIQ
jgi:aspartyl-tRNA(Asn)/glutamyl-tRNA(Gln) amidotransferase subunit A